jgi:hypothetical protein
MKSYSTKACPPEPDGNRELVPTPKTPQPHAQAKAWAGRSIAIASKIARVADSRFLTG